MERLLIRFQPIVVLDRLPDDVMDELRKNNGTINLNHPALLKYLARQPGKAKKSPVRRLTRQSYKLMGGQNSQDSSNCISAV